MSRTGVVPRSAALRRSVAFFTSSVVCGSLLIAPNFPAQSADAVAPSGPPTGNPPAAVATQPSQLVASAAGDVAALRTATTRTVRLPDGRFEEDLFAGPVNYQAVDSSWQPIDTTLTASGSSVKTTAGDVVSTLPTDLGSGPVIVSGGGHTVGLQLAGATGTGKVSGATETWAGALPGVDVALTDTTRGVKESLTLHSAAATAAFSYTLTVPSGAVAAVSADGAVSITEAGSIIATLPAAFMDDGSNTDSGHSTAVPYTVTKVNEISWRLTMIPDAAWLASPARVWPVVVDPTVWINYGTGYYACGIISNSPSTNHCSDTTFGVGSSAGVTYRGVVRWPALLTTVPLDAQVSEADFYPVATSALNGNTQKIDVAQLTKDFDGTVTWNSAKTGTAWSTAGGDYSSTPAGAANLPPGTGGRQTVNITNMVQDWLTTNGAILGVMVKADLENGTNVDYFDSTASAGNGPELKVIYQARFGTKGSASFFTRAISDRETLKVNNANGNLVVDATDLTLSSPQIPTAVGHTFNSRRADVRSTLGFGWVLDTGRNVTAKYDAGSGDIFYTAPGGNLYVFRPTTAGSTASFTDAPGSGATASYSATTFKVTLKFHNPFQVQVFNADGTLSSKADKNAGLTNARSQTFAYGTTFTGDSLPYLSSLTDTAGHVVTFNHPGYYDASISDGTRTVAFGYTGDLMSSDTHAVTAEITHYFYDSSDRISSITPPNGGGSYGIGYDSLGRVSSINDPGGNCTASPTLKCTTFAYTDPTVPWSDPHNGSAPPPGALGKTVVTDPLGHATTYTWDNRDRITKVTDALGHHRDKTWDDNVDAPATEADAMGTPNVSTATYASGTGNLTSLQAPSEPNSGTGPPVPGNRSSATYPLPSGTSSPTDFEPATAKDTEGNQTDLAYDGQGNLQNTKRHTTGAVDDSYTYQNNTTNCGGVAGQVCTATNGNSNTTSYTYSGTGGGLGSVPYGRLLTVTQPAPAPALIYTYDSLSRVITMKKTSTGPLTHYTYDNDDRITMLQYNGVTGCTSTDTTDINAGNCILYRYDTNGNLTQRMDATGTTYYQYTARNQEKYKQPGGSANATTITIDDAGNVYQYSDLGGTVTYTYNAANQLVSLAEPGGSCSSYPATSGGVTVPNSNRCTGFSVDNNGNRTGIAYPSGEKISYGYDNAGRTKSITAQHNTGGTLTTFFTRTLKYYNGGADSGLLRATNDNSASQDTAYTYDNLDRLTGLSDSGSNVYLYVYDADGNRTKETTPSATLYQGYNNADQLCWGAGSSITPPGSSCPATAPAGSVGVSWDTYGNQSNVVGYNTYTYNASQQVASVTRGGGSATPMTYAGPGNSERTTTGTTTIVNGLEGIASQTVGGTAYYFTRDPSGTLISMRTGAGGTSFNDYYMLDQQHSVLALTKADGHIDEATYTYDPYGSGTAAGGSLSTVNPFRYTSSYYDTNSAVYKMGARYYDPANGIFTQPDPSGKEANTYLYANGDPVNRIDPSGLDTFDDVVVGVALGLAIGGLVLAFAPAEVTLGAALLAATSFDLAAGAAAKTWGCDIQGGCG
jgi:RHS repeat-associated protein